MLRAVQNPLPADAPIIVISSGSEGESQPRNSPPKKRPKRTSVARIIRCRTCHTDTRDCTCHEAPIHQIRQNWSCIDSTLNDKKQRSYENTKKAIEEYIREKLKGLAVDSIQPAEWMAWLILWGEQRGR